MFESEILFETKTIFKTSIIENILLNKSDKDFKEHFQNSLLQDFEQKPKPIEWIIFSKMIA